MIIPQFPELEVTIKLFKDCPKESFPRVDSNFGIIDAANIYSTNVLYTAIYKALIESKYHKMRTKNLNSEVILCLYASTNIGEAFRTIGLNQNTTKDIITISIADKNSTADINQDIQGGECADFNDANLAEVRDVEKIKSIYKINQELTKGKHDLEELIVNSIQLRGL
ncbi:hypothetical protein ACO0QE_000685 [Hanseniaspora vineae]